MDYKGEVQRKKQSKHRYNKNAGCFTCFGYCCAIVLGSLFLLHFIVFLDIMVWDKINIIGLGGVTLVCLFEKKIEKLFARLNNKKKSSTFRSVGRFISITLVISIILSCIPFFSAFAKGNIENTFHIKLTTEDATDKTKKNKDSSEDKKSIQKNDKDKNISFLLDLRHIVSFDDSCSNALYWIINVDSPREYLRSIKSQKLGNIENGHIYDFTNENVFLNKMYEAQDYKRYCSDYRGWLKKLPLESQLIEVICSQEKQASIYPSYKIFFSISKNYQMLALEYYHQKESCEIAKYYYEKSILCDFSCIRYAETHEQYVNSIERLYYRYKDILLCGNNTVEEKNILQYLIEELE